MISSSRVALDHGASQTSFRSILNALARPGTVVPIALPDRQVAPALILPMTIGDVTSRISVIEDPDTYWGGLLVASGYGTLVDIEHADIVAATRLPTPDELRSLRVGQPDAPELGAKLAIQCGGFDDGPRIDLSGPGIEDTARLAISGIRRETLETLATINGRFPCGIDTWFFSERWLAAIPRSSRIELVFEEEQWATPR